MPPHTSNYTKQLKEIVAKWSNSTNLILEKNNNNSEEVKIADIFDIKSEMANRIPHATNISSSIIKQRHNFKKNNNNSLKNDQKA